MPAKRSPPLHVRREAPDLDEGHDPGFEQVAASMREGSARPIRTADGHVIRIGTASWTDPTMTAPGVFYPPDARTPEARLRHYASRFPLVEIDSTYYALPTRRIAELWIERTPDDFTFNVKAHAFMTGQPSDATRLPRELRERLPAALSAERRLYADDLPGDLRERIWAHFLDAIAPLQETGKLGAVLLQFPRWITPSRKNLALIEDAVARLRPLRSAVELRNERWYARDTARMLDWFAARGIALVMVDGPQGLPSSVPADLAVTSPELAMVRLHGRRNATWEQPGVPTVERYRWLYTSDELATWVPRIAEAARRAGEVHVLLNNCYGNYGAANALQLTEMVVRALEGLAPASVR